MVDVPRALRRRIVVAFVRQTPKNLVPPAVQQTASYEVNPLLCTPCGKEMKIRAIIMYKTLIWQILNGIGWDSMAPEFDPLEDLSKWEICQLVAGLGD